MTTNEKIKASIQDLSKVIHYIRTTDGDNKAKGEQLEYLTTAMALLNGIQNKAGRLAVESYDNLDSDTIKGLVDFAYELCDPRIYE